MTRKFFSANVVGRNDNSKLTPAILGSAEHNVSSHKLYIDAWERKGRWNRSVTLEEPGFHTTECHMVFINLDDYRSVEIWFDVEHRACRPDSLAPVYTRMEWTAQKGWDITYIVYQRGNTERVTRPARIGETTF